MSEVPDPTTWKRDYLKLSADIEAFTARRLAHVAGFTPPESDPSQGNVARLLLHHLNMSRELLWGEVNGGLEEMYQEDVDRLLTRGDEVEEL